MTLPMEHRGEDQIVKRRPFLWLLPFGLGLVSSCKRQSVSPPSSSSQPIRQADTPNAKDGDTTPPQCEALSLVWSTQQPLIKEVEIAHANHEQKKQKEYVNAEERWWFDCDSRQWEVKRPFAPGGIDSTHLFDIQYRINNKMVATWSVDTKKKTIQVFTKES
jgi:hypothetical protein